MLGALIVVVLATAGFSVAVVALRARLDAAARPAAESAAGASVTLGQAEGFVVVGAAALGLLAVAVAVLGWAFGRAGPAEALAVVGLMAYLLYLLAAAALLHRTGRELSRVASAGAAPARRPPLRSRPRVRWPRATPGEPPGGRSGSRAPASPGPARAGRDGDRG